MFIVMNGILAVQRLCQNEPLLKSNPNHAWENRVTFNPACVLVTERGELDTIIAELPLDAKTKKELSKEEALTFLLYRAQGSKTSGRDYSRSSMGLAILSARLRLLARCAHPVIIPEHDYENLGVEDGRLSRVGDRYYLFYTAYGSSAPQNRIRIAVASTTNFVEWTKHGLLRGPLNELDNKNAMLFEGKVGGRFLMLHRPMSGEDAMAIHWAEADDIFGEWTSKGVLMKPLPNAEFADTWIGGGAPPLLLGDGRYLILYHIGNRKANGEREYDLGIAIGDPSGEHFIVMRDEPLLRPTSPLEITADPELGVGNVLFVCGAYFYQGDLYFPYAGADSVVLAGRVTEADLSDYLRW
jgi:predicted GH43/DUF377 family glycosyl hydrolase